MPEFQFQGRDAQGVLIEGIRDSRSIDQLASSLLREGITPLTIDEIIKKHTAADWFKQFRGKKISTADLQLFSRQCYALIKAGVPIATTMARLAETTRNDAFASALRDIVDDLSAGQSLASALEQYPQYFSNLYINLVKVGESSGRLEVAFEQVSHYLQLEEQTQRRFKTALRYPMFVLATMLVGLIVINTLVIPAFAKVFSSLGAQLPLPTQILIATSNFIMQYHWLILLIVFGTGFLVTNYIRTKQGRWQWHRLVMKIPILGWILNRIFLARFSRIFGLLLRSGINLLASIELVGAALGNVYLEGKVMRMHEHIARGETLTRAAHHANLFSPLVLQMISLGEETGNVETLMIDVAEYYEREVDYDLARLGDYIEPILILLLAGMVMVLALGVFLPMWDLVNVRL